MANEMGALAREDIHNIHMGSAVQAGRQPMRSSLIGGGDRPERALESLERRLLNAAGSASALAGSVSAIANRLHGEGSEATGEASRKIRGAPAGSLPGLSAALSDLEEMLAVLAKEVSRLEVV